MGIIIIGGILSTSLKRETMVRGVDHFGGTEGPKQSKQSEQTHQVPVEEKLHEYSKDLIRTQHKTLRKQIAKMLSDSQKGLRNEEMHFQKASKTIEEHRKQLNSSLHAFPEKNRDEFVLSEISKQQGMLGSAKQTVSGKKEPSHSLGSTAPKHKNLTQEQGLQALHKSLFKDSSEPSGRITLQLSMQYANICLDSAKSQNLTQTVQFLQTLIAQEQDTLKSSPTATFQTFLDKYGYQGYHTGAKDSLLLSPEMEGHGVFTEYNLPMRYVIDISVFMNPKPSSKPAYNYPPTPEIQAMSQNVSNLEKLNTPIANWVIKQIQFNPDITMGMSGAQVMNYLMQNYDIFNQVPGVTITQLQDVIKAINGPSLSNVQLLAFKINSVQYPKGSAEYNLQQALVSQCTKESSVSDFENWIQSSLINSKADIYMQFLGINTTQVISVLGLAGFSGTIPKPTQMDQLCVQAYKAYQADQKSPIYKDLYQELQSLGSASENMQALQKWGDGMLNSADFKNSSALAQANFCVWTGNITLSAMNTILNEWTQSGNVGQAALAKFILGKNFSSLDQMRSFFNPNSPSYGFAKFDIYFQVPSLLQSSNPQSLVQGFLSDLFANSSTKAPTPEITQVDTAYAKANAALSGASAADKALYNALINECKAMGSNWTQISDWAGWQSLSSIYAKASAAAQNLFLTSCGITNEQTAPLVGSEYYLNQMLSNFQPTSQTYKMLNEIITELQGLVSGDKTWADFQSWVKGNLFAKDDIYMLCPDASNQQMSSIYQYIMGPDASLPTETTADKNFIDVYNAMNNPGVYSGNKALYQDLLNAMLAVGSSTDNQASAIQSYFNANPSVLTQLKNDWANADSDGQALFEKYTNNWNPTNS